MVGMQILFWKQLLNSIHGKDPKQTKLIPFRFWILRHITYLKCIFIMTIQYLASSFLMLAEGSNLLDGAVRLP